MFDLIRNIRLFDNIKKQFPSIEPFFSHNLDELSLTSVDRERYLVDLAKNKKIIHFGFLDFPLLEDKVSQNQLLHLKIKEAADFVLGVDIDEASLLKYRQITGDNNNLVLDIQNGIENRQMTDSFEMIFFPEVLEHVLNPGIVLSNLRKLCILNNNATLCITVPNAFSIDGFVAAMNNLEIVHPDHYYYFSPVTLTKLLADCGFQEIKLVFYGRESVPGLTKSGIIATCKP